MPQTALRARFTELRYRMIVGRRTRGPRGGRPRHFFAFATHLADHELLTRFVSIVRV